MMSSHAQNIFLEWARTRKKEGSPVKINTVAGLMGVARYESGGGVGANFANVTSHLNEAQSNNAGSDGSSFGTTRAVENFLRNHPTSHETNFGGVQLSPNVLVNYHLENSMIKFVNHFSDPSSLYQSCMTDMAYSDKADALQKITDLYEKRDQLPAWLNTIKNFTAKSQSACRSSSKCVAASANIGRWLSYCPRMNMDNGAVVYENKPWYFGVRKFYAGQNPEICKNMIAAELNGDSKSQLATENQTKQRSSASHSGDDQAI